MKITYRTSTRLGMQMLGSLRLLQTVQLQRVLSTRSHQVTDALQARSESCVACQTSIVHSMATNLMQLVLPNFAKKRGKIQVSQATPPQELLVIGELDDEGHLEGVLQPLGEHEGDQVAQVQCL